MGWKDNLSDKEREKLEREEELLKRRGERDAKKNPWPNGNPTKKR